MDVLCDYDNADSVSVDTLALEHMVLEERTREINQLNTLSKKVCNLHTSILYYRNSKSKMGSACYETWRTLVKKIGGTPNGWRDLGYALDVAQDDLDYIMNTRIDDDPADTVLKVYGQNEKATLDKILDAFIKMKRYDILKALENPLSEMAQCFTKEDSGYHSNGKSDGSRNVISLKDLPYSLPPALNKNVIIKEKEPSKPEPYTRKTETKEVKSTTDDQILFLTYAYDGYPTALNIQLYVDNWIDVPGVKVITLNDRKDEVYQNPEKFIREYFEKADFIVPIVTPGYISEITSYNASAPNTTDNLDHKYVNFIYNLIVNHYIHATGCLNKKVRSVIPQNTRGDLYAFIGMYPVLLPWTYETNFDEQFKAFLKK